MSTEEAETTTVRQVGVLWKGEPDTDVCRALSGDGLALVAQADGVGDVLEWPVSVDVLVLAVRRLGARENTVLGKLRTILPEAALVVVSDVLTRQSVYNAERAGADGLVLRASVGATLHHAVHAASTGQLVLPRELAGWPARPVLTVRERQVLAMIVLGCPNSEIARRLFVAETTVKSHLSTAFAKLGVRSRSEAVGLILDPQSGLGTGILAISDPDPEPRAVTRRRPGGEPARLASKGAA